MSARNAVPAPEAPRLAWALTGSGHFVSECLDLMETLGAFDLFVSRAGEEVARMYRKRLSALAPRARIFRDVAASAPPVGRFYAGLYHTLAIAPATSNTVAKCALGLSDTLVTNVFAQAGKCRVPAIVFACDTAPEMVTTAPSGLVKVYPRRIDLEHVERLRGFEATTVTETFADFAQALRARMTCLNA